MFEWFVPLWNPVAAKAGKINPAEIASVDLLKKFHTPKATELSNLVLATCLAKFKNIRQSKISSYCKWGKKYCKWDYWIRKSYWVSIYNKEY